MSSTTGPPLTTCGPKGYLFPGGHERNYRRPEAREIQKPRKEADTEVWGNDSRLSKGPSGGFRAQQARCTRRVLSAWDLNQNPLISLQWQARAKLLAPPPLVPPVSSPIQTGTKGRLQASQPAHHGASAPRPTSPPERGLPPQPPPAGQKRLQVPDNSDRLTDLRSPVRNYL